MSVIQDNSITTNSVEPASGQSLVLKKAGGTASITVQTDGDLTLAENAYLGSGKGIYFDGQTTSANFLDDYEEGTFTYSITDSGIGSIGNETGYYTKIGNVVTISVYEGGPTSGNPTGNLSFANLPFTSASYNYSTGVLRGRYNSTKMHRVELSGSSTTVYVYQVSHEDATSTSTVTYNNGSHNERIGFNLTYFTS